MHVGKVAWGWPRPQVNNDEENKWGLPTWDPKCIKTFLNYAFA